MTTKEADLILPSKDNSDYTNAFEMNQIHITISDSNVCYPFKRARWFPSGKLMLMVL